MASTKAVAEAYRAMAANWHSTYEAHVSTETLVLAQQLLSDVPDDLLGRAVCYCLTHRQFMPNLHELRLTCIELGVPDVPSAEEAWAEVRRYVRSTLPNRRPFSTPLITETEERMGGFSAYGRDLASNENLWFSRFRAVYEGLVADRRDRLLLPPNQGALAVTEGPFVPAGALPQDLEPCRAKKALPQGDDRGAAVARG